MKNIAARAASLALGLTTLVSAVPELARAADPAPVVAAGHPELWVAHGPQGTLYLLGSFHLLRPGAQWEDARINKALNSADHVWFELTDFDDMALAQQIFVKYGLYDTPELSQHLDKKELDHLGTALGRHGMTIDQVQRLKPWAAALLLAQKELADDGFDGAQGVDLTLYHKALAAKKDVKGFETLDFQMGLLAHLDDHDGTSFLDETLDDDDEGTAKMSQLADAWLHGNEAALTADSVTEMKTDYPALYQKMLVDRNNSWLPRIEDMARAKGTTLVVVGAGHLVGPDGVVARLRAAGFDVQRVP